MCGVCVNVSLFCRQGDEASTAYIILHGRVRAVVTKADGKKELMDEYGRGEQIGVVRRGCGLLQDIRGVVITFGKGVVRTLGHKLLRGMLVGIVMKAGLLIM